MRRFVSTIMILTVINLMNFTSYASCDMDINYEKFIDFSEVIEGKACSISQEIDNKKVKITRYEQFSKTNLDLEKEIYDAIKELIQKQNGQVDPNVFIHVFDRAIDLLCQTTAAEANALSQIAKMIDTQTLNKLSEEEQKKAAMNGRDSAVSPAIGATAISTALGALSKAGLAKIVGSETAKALLAKVGLSATGTIASIVPVAGGLAVGGLVLYGCSKLYNELYIIPLTNRLQNLLLVRQHIYAIIKDDVINHRWIDGNVLITAAPTDSSCTKGYAHFHHIDGVHYNKSQKAINWEFAKSECKFLNEDQDECYQEAKETIECLWDNQDDPSQCKNNQYYYKNNGKYALEL